MGTPYFLGILDPPEARPWEPMTFLRTLEPPEACPWELFFLICPPEAGPWGPLFLKGFLSGWRHVHGNP